MRWRVVFGNVGTLLKLLPIPMLVPVVVAFVMEPGVIDVGPIVVPHTVPAFALTAAASLLAGLALERLGRAQDFRESEAYVLVGVGWLSVTGVAAVPLALSGVLSDPFNAAFEAMSAVTTTGATAIEVPMELVPPSVHMWRAILQWLGGMGIIVLYVAILRGLATSGARLMRAEVPGGGVVRLRPRITSTAKALWGLYAGLTVAAFATFLIIMMVDVGLRPGRAAFDAAVHAFTVLPTGGFGTRSQSIESFGSAWLEWAVIAFMLLAGINFALHFYLVRGKYKRVYRDEEFRFYMAIMGIGTLLVFAALMAAPAFSPFWQELGGKGILNGVRHAMFQTVSMVTTTGFSSANFDSWPEAARFLMLFMMFVGGSAGSTGGSIKVVRVLLAFKVVRMELLRIGHPRAVLPVRLGGAVVGSETLRRLTAFLFVYLTIFIAGTFAVVAFSDLSILDAASGAAATLGNVGPALGELGPDMSYGVLPNAAKVTMIAMMWLGRLELFAVLMLFSPGSYK